MNAPDFYSCWPKYCWRVYFFDGRCVGRRINKLWARCRGPSDNQFQVEGWILVRLNCILIGWCLTDDFFPSCFLNLARIVTYENFVVFWVASIKSVARYSDLSASKSTSIEGLACCHSSHTSDRQSLRPLIFLIRRFLSLAGGAAVKLSDET